MLTSKTKFLSVFNKSPKITSPAYQLILSLAVKNQKILFLTFLTYLLSSFVEGSTFGIIFIALGVIGSSDASILSKLPILRHSIFYSLLSNLSQIQIFSLLIFFAIVLQIIRSSLKYLSGVISGYLIAVLEPQATDHIFSYIMKLSFPCVSSYKTGNLVKYITDAGIAVRYQVELWNQLLINTFLILTYSIILLTISVPLSAIALLLGVGLIGVRKYLIPKIGQLSEVITETSVQVSKEIVESLQALRLIHTYSQQDKAINKVQYFLRKLVILNKQQSHLKNIAVPVGEVFTLLIIGVLLVLGVSLLQKSSQFVLPALVTFVVALNRLSSQLQGAVYLATKLADNQGNILRLDEILDSSDKQFTRTDGISFKELKAQIEFENVSLLYPRTARETLLNLSFQIPKGKVTALVGRSGSGKSSIADLLVGLYEPTSGTIKVDDTNIREFSLNSWHQNIGVVSQDTFIFNDSVLENIRFAYPEASYSEVIEAAKAAQIHDFIESLNEGYNSLVGERGFRLSGGQRQRISIARALLKKPQILIFDEATSSLDSQSEELVQEALKDFFKENCTVLVIAHRLSTIVDADQILVLHQGKLVEKGTHSELLKLSGWYMKYWSLQTSNTET